MKLSFAIEFRLVGSVTGLITLALFLPCIFKEYSTIEEETTNSNRDYGAAATLKTEAFIDTNANGPCKYESTIPGRSKL